MMTKPQERSTRTTVLIAGAANVFVAVIKIVAGVLTASSALLAEAAHSAADTLNQAFLLASTDQSFFDLEAHYQQIGVVYPTYFECGPGGAAVGGTVARGAVVVGASVARVVVTALPAVEAEVAVTAGLLPVPPACLGGVRAPERATPSTGPTMAAARATPSPARAAAARRPPRAHIFRARDRFRRRPARAKRLPPAAS